MAASSADKITQTKGASGNPSVTTVSAARSVGGTSLTCTALTNWPTDTQVHFITYSKNADGTKNNSSQLDWKGTVSSSTSITSMALQNGTDAGNAVGDFVEMGPTASWAEDLYDGVTKEHSSTGAHDSTKVAMLAGTQTFTGNKTFSGTVSLPDDTVTTSTLADSAVTPVKLGYTTNGVKVGIIPKATFGTSGNKAITGVGFKARYVKLMLFPVSGTFSSLLGFGYIDRNGSQYTHFTVAGAGGFELITSQTECLVAATSNGGSITKVLSVSYASIDSDGFTLNVATPIAAYDVLYEAYQ